MANNNIDLDNKNKGHINNYVPSPVLEPNLHYLTISRFPQVILLLSLVKKLNAESQGTFVHLFQILDPNYAAQRFSDVTQQTKYL